MPPRLNHRKSRMGCLCCKERKIKCNEKKPNCSACERHGVRCVYSDVVPPRRKPNVNEDAARGASTTVSEVASSPLPPPPGPDTPYLADNLEVSEDHRKQIELFLLHRFTVVVSSTFPSAESQSLRHLYSRDAVELSFQYGFLQNTILAIAALYTALQRLSHHSVASISESGLPSAFSETDFGQVHRIYLNLAIQQQRAALGTINAQNADALGLTSIMLSIMAARLLPESAEMEAVERSPYSPPIQSLYISEATGAITYAAYTYLPPESPLRKLLQQGGMNYSSHATIFNPEEAAPFQHLLDFEDLRQVEERDAKTTLAYTRAVALMGGIHAAILRRVPTHEICRRIMSFAPLVPKHFMQLLAEKRPRALVIFAHYMVSLYLWSVLRSVLINYSQWSSEWSGIGGLMELPRGKYMGLFASRQMSGNGR